MDQDAGYHAVLGGKEYRRFPLRYGRNGSRRVLGMGNPAGKRAISLLLFIAEVYNPGEYKNYLFRGKFDYLYDKVGLYDTLRAVTCGYESATAITRSWQSLGGIEKRMLNFLENHDEQRIASDFFASNPRKAIPALIVSACMNTNPMMIYFGQEFG